MDLVVDSRSAKFHPPTFLIMILYFIKSAAVIKTTLSVGIYCASENNYLVSSFMFLEFH